MCWRLLKNSWYSESTAGAAVVVTSSRLNIPDRRDPQWIHDPGGGRTNLVRRFRLPTSHTVLPLKAVVHIQDVIGKSIDASSHSPLLALHLDVAGHKCSPYGSRLKMSQFLVNVFIEAILLQQQTL